MSKIVFKSLITFCKYRRQNHLVEKHIKYRKTYSIKTFKRFRSVFVPQTIYAHSIILFVFNVFVVQLVVFAIRTINDLCTGLTGSFESPRYSILDGSEKTKPAAAWRGRCAGPEMYNLLTADGLSTTSVSPSRPVTMLYRNGSRDMQTRTRGYTTVFVRKKIIVYLHIDRNSRGRIRYCLLFRIHQLCSKRYAEELVRNNEYEKFIFYKSNIACVRFLRLPLRAYSRIRYGSPNNVTIKIH